MYNFTVTLDNSAKKPLYMQLYEFILREIREKKLDENERMPSKKALSSHLGISVNTVETAYELLVQEGYLKSVARSGFYVQYIDAPVDKLMIEAEEKPEQKTEYRADFKTNAVDVSSFPYATWVKLSKEVMYGNPELLNAGEVKGDYELRKNIAKYLGEFRGVSCLPSQIVVGAGIEYLLTLIIEILGEGRNYAIENPGYSKADAILKNNGRAVSCINLDENGISVKELYKTDADTVYITPSHQFPTGIIMPVERRTELIRWAEEKEGRYIIEDDYNSEFNFSKRPLRAVQGISGSNKVIYLNTFSRILAPSIRIAYMVLPPKLLKIYEKKFRGYSSTVPRFEQHTLSRFISEDYLSRHLNRVKNIYKKRRDLLISVLKNSPFDIEISGERAGLHLLIKSEASAEIMARAEKYGIKLYNADDYCFIPQKTSAIIIGYAGVCDEDIELLRIALMDN